MIRFTFKLMLLTLICTTCAFASNVPGCYKTYGQNFPSGSAGLLGSTPAEIHAKFPSIIEGNFTKGNAPKIIEALSDKELGDLAALYGKATFNQTSPLLTVLAKRLSAKDLQRIASAFGQGPTRLAVANSAPEDVAVSYFKLPALVALSASAPVAAAISKLQSAAPSVYYTPYEIYLDFRTAPDGALGVTDALFESATYISTYVSAAYGVGTAIGTGLNYLLENYDPSLDESIGGTIDAMAYDLAEAGSEASKGDYESALDSLFGTPLPETSSDLGDFNVTLDMSFYYTGEAGC